MARINQQSVKGNLAFRLVLLALVLELTVSANLLTWIGVPYVAEGGNFLLKLHPGTYLLGIVFLMLIARGPSGVWAREGLLLGALSAMAVSLGYLLALTGTGNLVVILDTFLPACLLAIILSRATPAELRQLRLSLQLLFAANAVLAIGEMTVHSTLVPLYLNNAAYQPHMEDFRPTALFDHPLTGAVMTMLGLAVRPDAGRWRIPYYGLLWAALFAFGGRMAVAATIGTTLVSAGLYGSRLLLLRDPRTAHVVLTSLAVLVLTIILLGGALYAGLGTRISGHLYWDDSAQVRLAQWQLLDQLDGWQWLFGTRRDDLLAMLVPLRLGPGVEVIENFWLLMFVNLGAAGFPLFMAGLLALLLWCWQQTKLQGRLLLCAVMLVASTSNSLGRKSSILICLVAAVLCLRPERRVTRCRDGNERNICRMPFVVSQVHA